MGFYEILDQVVDLLRRRGRVTYRALKREFQVDDAFLEDLKAEGIGFLPTTLSEALDELEQDEVVLEALGREYGAYYLRVKREEWNRYHEQVTPWEIREYLTRF